MQSPEVHFTKVDGLSIAWQQFGAGPDVLIIPGLVSNVELVWEREFYHRVNELLAKHLRLTTFDKRGMGLSERTQENQTIDQRMTDVLAVMDAAGIERAHLLGISEGGLIAQIFASRYPDRVHKIVLGNTVSPRRDGEVGYRDRSNRHLGLLIRDWGQNGRSMADGFSPTHSSNEAFTRWLARFQRLSGTQHDVIRQLEDIQPLISEDPVFLSDIVAPTLIVSSSHDQIVDPAGGDWLHQRIPNSERVMLDSDDHFMWLGDKWDQVCSICVEFFTGAPIVAAVERRFGSVWVSSTVRDMLMGGSHQFTERGEHTLKGFDDAWRLYELATA